MTDLEKLIEENKALIEKNKILAAALQTIKAHCDAKDVLFRSLAENALAKTKE